MQHNQAKLYPNNLNSHASLLLLASPTIISSPLQNNSSSPQAANSDANAPATSARLNPNDTLARKRRLPEEMRPAGPIRRTPAARTNTQHEAPTSSEEGPARSTDEAQSKMLANRTAAAPMPTTIAIIRKMPSKPLTAASNLDNDAISNPEAANADRFINFEKPQSEIFKKLDGKIQKIVAAHSNLNKLYALNDYSSLSAKRPFELPAQLPPPPPWVPKGSSEFGCSQWADEAVERLNSDFESIRPGPSATSPEGDTKAANVKRKAVVCMSSNKSASLTIDSAISKLHQRRQLQQGSLLDSEPLVKRPRVSSDSEIANRMSMPGTSSSTATTNNSPPKISPAQFSVLAQKIKETFESESKFVLPKNPPRLDKMTEEEKKNYKASLFAMLAKEYVIADQNSRNQESTTTPQSQPRPKSRFDNMTPEERRKFFQEELVARIKQEIASVTRDLKLQNSPTRPKNVAPIPQSLKFSPQSLFNTIRRETSLLLNKRQGGQLRTTSASLLQPINRQNTQNNLINFNRPILNRTHTIKVIVPPTEYHQSPEAEIKREKIVSETQETKPALSYQVIKRKIRLFQEYNKIPIGKHVRLLASPVDPSKRKTIKSLDKIVDRLQAKCSTTLTEVDRATSPQKTTFQQNLINSSASLLQSSRGMSQLMSNPTPIPVFRSSFVATRVINVKSKKSKRGHIALGLKLTNYSERECPQPTNDKITVEQFAKCLNLVRANDASLQRHQKQLLQSESRWRLPIGNRPLRLRRIRGDAMPHMPASASYRATRKVGLQ